jgi:hypothetical protein
LNPIITAEAVKERENQITVYPNPFPDAVNVEFELKKNEYLNFVVYDLSGRAVKVLMREQVKAGVQRFSFNAGPLAKGIYILKIFNAEGSYVVTRKIEKS